MKYGVIWDLDGTLWDACDQISAAWNSCLAGLGIDRRFSPDECRSFCGKLLEEIAEAAFPEKEKAWREAVISACFEAECGPLSQYGGRLYEGFEEVLRALHKSYFMAVVSNCGEGYIEAFYQGNQTKRFFDDEENAGRTGMGKAENIRLVLQRNGLDRAVYIGDTEGDFLAAQKAGIEFIHAAYGFGTVKEPCKKIHSLFELPKLLEDIFSE